MKRYKVVGLVMVALAASCGGVPSVASTAARAADTPPSAAAATTGAKDATDSNPPMVKPASPGVFLSRKLSATRFHLAVTGHSFTSRDAIEKYLAYRAAELAIDQNYSWFTLIQNRVKGDKTPAPKSDPGGMRYSFRLEYWQPTWRYKTAASSDWKRWSPFSGTSFFIDGMDPKTVTDYEVSADLVFHKGMVQDDNPLAFDAGAVSDFLINQVEPPQ